MPSIMRNYELIKEVWASKLKQSEKEELVEEILRWVHADPKKNNMAEVRNLVVHGIRMLSSSEISSEKKLNAADEYLRVASIGRVFRPELGDQIDQLCGLCNKIKRANSTGTQKADHLEKASNSLIINKEEIWSKYDKFSQKSYSQVQPDSHPLISIGMTVHIGSPLGP